jgi:hypothetical protein
MQTSETNPIGLTTGLRYMIHGTEPFDPSGMPRNPRRSTSMGMNSLLLQETSPTSVMGLSNRPVLPPYGRQTSGMISGLPTSLRELAPLSMSPSATTPKSEGYFPPMMPVLIPQISDAPAAPASPAQASITPNPPISEATVPAPSTGQLEAAPADQPTLSPVAESTPATVPKGPPPIRTSHYRTSSRSTLSPTFRETPLFAPSSLGRPASVASSHSTHSRGMPIGIPGGKSAPAMAITSSTGSGNFSPGSHGWAVGRPPSGSSVSASRRDSGSGSAIGTGTGTGTGTTGSPLGLGSASGAMSTTSGFSSMARTISRGFSIKPQRTTSGEGASGSTPGVKGKQSAADILKQYGESK